MSADEWIPQVGDKVRVIKVPQCVPKEALGLETEISEVDTEDSLDSLGIKVQDSLWWFERCDLALLEAATP